MGKPSKARRPTTPVEPVNPPGTFWMIWNPKGRTPTRMHATVEDANREAERLALAAEGEVFIVLKATHAFSVAKPAPLPVERVALTEVLDNIPF